MALNEDCSTLCKGMKSSQSDSFKLATEPGSVTWGL